MNYRKLYRAICILYIIGGALVSVYHFVKGNRGFVLLGPATWPFLLIPPVGEKLLGLKLGYPMRCLIIAFTFLAFSLGTGMRWHDSLFLFDDLSHFLSGVLFTVTGFCIYGRVCEKKPVNRGNDVFLQVTYAFFFSMFVAVLWEIGEYACYMISGLDVQHTLTEGVHDTMRDIITCVLGSVIAAAGYMRGAAKGGKSLAIRIVESFDEANRG